MAELLIGPQRYGSAIGCSEPVGASAIGHGEARPGIVGGQCRHDLALAQVPVGAEDRSTTDRIEPVVDINVVVSRYGQCQGDSGHGPDREEGMGADSQWRATPSNA